MTPPPSSHNSFPGKFDGAPLAVVLSRRPVQRWRRRGFSPERSLQSTTASFAALPELEMAAMSLLLRAAARAGVRQPLTLSAGLGRTGLLGPSASRSGVIVSLRHASEGKKLFFIRATRFYDHRFVRLLNWYVMLTGIPVLIVIAYANVFIGQAELAEIPEGYIPEHWEYYKHPISRWISRYFYSPPEKEYEKEMARLYIEFEKKKLRTLEAEASHLMFERGDGPWHQEEAPGTSMVDYAPKANPDF